jgi:hypothetical protein
MPHGTWSHGGGLLAITCTTQLTLKFTLEDFRYCTSCLSAEGKVCCNFSFKAIRGSVTRITIHGVRQRLGNCEETGESPWTKAQCQQSLSAPHQKNGLLPQNQASRLKV